MNLSFDPDILSTFVGGRSALDLPKLSVRNLDEATEFIKAYGYDLNQNHDLEQLWYYYRRAYVFLTEKMGFAEAEIPVELRSRKELGDIRKLLLNVSAVDTEKNVKRWSCALLRAIHVFVHAENDLFSSFSEEIQNQILTPLQEKIGHKGSGDAFLKTSTGDEILLKGFEIKPFKTSSSTVIKLLAKPDALAMKLFDRVGVRFITKNKFDAFRVIRFLVNEHLLSFAHVMPDQSSNNLYPTNLLIEVSEHLRNKQVSLADVQKVENELQEYWHRHSDRADLVRKPNSFSGEDYRFIKFIARKLIVIKSEDSSSQHGVRFFYPYEIQIMDEESHQNILEGPADHRLYKERQLEAAKKRLFKDYEMEN